jgi:SH3-like domain-containing protein
MGMNRLTEAIEQEVPYCPDSDYEIGYNNGLNMAKAIAIKLDAVPVVRCKDCKKDWCYLRQELGPEGFCSAGERRTDETN